MKRKVYVINMPKKIGLESGKHHYFVESEKGYWCKLNEKEFIGMPKSIIENNPKLYTEVKKEESS